MKKILFFLLCAGFLLSAASVFSQNLMDNPEYRKGLEFQNLAKQAYSDGDYDKSVEYSNMAQDLFKKARESAEQMRLRYVAYNLKNRAADRMKYADFINAQANYAEAYTVASASMGVSESAFKDEAYQVSIDASRFVLETLKDIQPVLKSMDSVATQPKEPDKTPAAADGTKPQYYTVRLIPNRRDCFWRIAEYDFIYGDPWKWPKIYEENKNILPNPNNPHLILPGMKLKIPNLPGENRSGEWQPPK